MSTSLIDDDFLCQGTILCLETLITTENVTILCFREQRIAIPVCDLLI